MRLLSTLCLLLFSSVCFSQIYDMVRAADYKPKNSSIRGNDIYIFGMRGDLSTISNIPIIQPAIVRMDSVNLRYKSPDLNILPTKKNTSSKPVDIRIRCMRTLTADDNPLIVIDGVPLEEYSLLSINPNDIESINILKSATASALYGCRAAWGVIIITTKRAKIIKFIIKDFLDGNRIPGATVSFISADKKDTIMMAANDSGVVVADKLKSTVGYDVKVSAIGYKLLNQNLRIRYKNEPQEILLEQDVKTCNEVILSSGGHYHGCPKYYCTRKVSECSMLQISDTVYTVSNSVIISNPSIQQVFPNPAQRGSTVTIATKGLLAEQVVVRLFDLSGKILLSQPQKAFKGLNRFTINTDPCWAAGIYFVQLYANGKLLASDKVIIQ